MDKTTTYRTKGVPVIQDNGYGGCMWVTANKECKVELLQQDMVIGHDSTMKVEVIGCSLSGDIGKGLEMLTSLNNVAAGVAMLGEIRVYKRYSPIDPEDPLICISTGPDGLPIKDAQGRYSWVWLEYVEEE